MSEDLKIDVDSADQPSDITPEEGSSQPQEDPFVSKAKEMGWRPKEEFQGEATDFVDAKEFVQRAPLFEKIESQNKLIKNLNKSMEALRGHYTKVREMEYERALNALKAARQDAISESDGQKFETVDKQIKRVEREFEQVQAENKGQTDAPDPSEFVAWQERNSWYTKDAEMRDYADTIGTKLHAQGNMTPSEVLQEVTKKVKATFSHKFVNPNKANAPDVSVSSGRGGKAADASDSFEMSDMERNIMNTILRDPESKKNGLTKEKYIADLKALEKAGKR
jgi:hypothetical protein